MGALTILAVLLVAVVAVVLHVQGTNTVKERRAELAGVDAEIAAVQTQVTELQRYEAYQQLAVARRETVKALADGRFAWAPTLRDVARVLPADTFLSELCADGGAGGCATGLRSAIPNATAVAVQGCTSSQDQVANLMTRLRDVRGVTRVSLASSSSTGEEEAAGDCPKGTPPQFELVVFFERSPVTAAGQANGSGSPTPTPTPTSTATPSATPAATP